MTVSGPDGIDVLFTAEQIAGRVEELAGEIVGQIDGDLLVVVILKGSFVFAADLIRALDRNGVPARVDFITLSSYQEGTESSGRVVLAHDLSEDVKGQDVLIVDDHPLICQALVMAMTHTLSLQRVRVASSLADALSAIKAEGVPDAIVLDLKLPDVEGGTG